MRKLALALVTSGLLTLGMGATAMAGEGPPPKVTICHVAGRADDPANYITLTLPYVAVYGQAGHFYENGTPRAGHEQDSLGECPSPPTTTTVPVTNPPPTTIPVTTTTTVASSTLPPPTTTTIPGELPATGQAADLLLFLGITLCLIGGTLLFLGRRYP